MENGLEASTWDIMRPWDWEMTLCQSSTPKVLQPLITQNPLASTPGQIDACEKGLSKTVYTHRDNELRSNAFLMINLYVLAYLSTQCSGLVGT